MQLSVQCNEEFIFNSLEEYEAVLTEYPELVGFLEDSIVGKPSFYICPEWDSGQADPIENEPVLSDVPTLLMGGEFDPITPPDWGRHAAETLENGHFFQYPGVGHGASAAAACPRDMLITFLNDPSHAPDDACIAEMGMQFVVPAEGEPVVELEPFTNEEMGISGLSPLGWTEPAPGVFSRGSSGLDVAALVIQAAPESARALLTRLTGQLGLDKMPPSVGEREANNLTWTLYAVEVQGLSVDIALAESKGTALIMLLQSAPNERDGLYKLVFVPAVDALTLIETSKLLAPFANASLGDTRTRPADGMVMVYVPDGTFQMGSSEAEIEAQLSQCQRPSISCSPGFYRDETPQHTVTLTEGFWMDQTEVTNDQFVAFLNEYGDRGENGANLLVLGKGYCRIRQEDGEYMVSGASADHPVVMVTWHGADSYCEWVGGRLPTEAEWEYAARGPEGYIYPWGNDAPTRELAQFGASTTALVGSHPDGASWCGVYDLAGNVWEWTADRFGPYPSGPQENPTGPPSGSIIRVIHGGGWHSPPREVRAAFRLHDTAASGYNG